MSQIIVKERGTVILRLDNASKEVTEKLEQDIVTLWRAGVFTVKNGSVTLHFDHDGVLQEIETRVRNWRRRKA